MKKINIESLIDQEESLGFDKAKWKRVEDPQYDELIENIEKPSKMNELYDGKKVSKESLTRKFSGNKDILNKKSKKIIKKKQAPLQINDLLAEINEQDEINEKNQHLSNKQDIEKSESVSFQIKLESQIIGFRLKMQSILDSSKYLPKKWLFNRLSNSVKTKNFSLHCLIVSLIDNLSKIDNSLYQKSFSKNTINNENSSNLIENFKKSKLNLFDCENIFEKAEQNFLESHDWIEQCLGKWSEKTQILSNMGGLNKLMQTPIGQVRKMMENKDKLIMKSQLKRKTMRILGEELENLHKDYDEEIWDDGELYQDILKRKMEENEGISEKELTGLYLLERKNREAEKKGKIVERKASKARKLRYDVHYKLINFMQISNENKEIEGRNEIIEDLKTKWGENNEIKENIQREDNGFILL